MDAASEEEAERAVLGGRARCVVRGFYGSQATQPSMDPRLRVHGEHDRAGHDFEYDTVEETTPSAFNNARFTTAAGEDYQAVVQESE